ncbi:MAG: translation initiation factor IF-2, partial [Patiriisocius sp.]
MSEGKTTRLNKVLRELNISLDRAVEYLADKGHEIESRPTTKISGDVYQVLLDGFQTDASKKAASKEVGEEKRKEKEAIRAELEAKQEVKRAEDAKKEEVLKAKAKKLEVKTVGKIDIENLGKPVAKKEEEIKEVAVKTETPKVEVSKVEVPKVEDEVPKVETPKEVVVEALKETKEKPVIEEVKEIKVSKPISEVEKEASKNEKKADVKNENSKPDAKPEEVTAENAEAIKTQYKKLNGPNFTGKKIDLKQFEKPKKKKPEPKAAAASDPKKKRKRIVTKIGAPGSRSAARGAVPSNSRAGNGRGPYNKAGRTPRPAANVKKEEPTEADIQKQVRETLEKLQGKSSKGKGAKYRRNKRDARREHSDAELEAQALGNKILKVTEFVTVSEVATMMEVPVTNIISACMSLGMMVTMNQRLDAETLVIVAEEFDHKVEFVGAEVEESI